MRAATLALFVANLALAQGPPASAPARAALDATTFDFGQLQPGIRANHRFRISNAGGATLRITRVNASCGCTSAVVGKNELGPGESTELEVAFDTTGMKGKVRKNVELVTDDPVRPSQTVFIEADVAPAIRVASDQVLFLDLKPGDRRKASLKLESGTGSEILVTDAELSRAPWLGVTTRTVGLDLFVDFELLARRLPKGKSSGTDSVVLHVVNPGHALVGLTAHWEKESPLLAQPERVALDGVAGQDLPATVTLTARDGKPFRIKSVKTTNPLFQVDPPGKAARSQVLHVLLSGKAPAGTYDERILLTLDRPGSPEVALRAAATLR